MTKEKLIFVGKATIAHVITYAVVTIIVILGIFNTYGPAHGSIQGLIYLAPIEGIPFSASLGILETMAQPLLFSIVLVYQRKKKLHENYV